MSSDVTPPQLPGRLLTKRNVCPSRASVGQKSLLGEFTGAPTLRGGPHGASTLARVDTQMSMPPCPPGRLDAMNNARPSAETNGQPSSDAVLSSGSVPATSCAFTAFPHSPVAARANDAASGDGAARGSELVAEPSHAATVNIATPSVTRFPMVLLSSRAVRIVSSGGGGHEHGARRPSRRVQ